jgi:hypothetical protein
MLKPIFMPIVSSNMAGRMLRMPNRKQAIR